MLRSEFQKRKHMFWKGAGANERESYLKPCRELDQELSYMQRDFVEFFAGIGLVREGLEQTGWRVVLANDIDPRKEILYVKNYGAEHFILGDIHNLLPSEIPEAMLATASFPCIDLSLAGNRKGLDGEHSGAFWGFNRLLEGMGSRRPPLVFLENVSGFLTSKGGSDFIAAISALNKLGYRCDAFEVNASYFTPQSRPRIFVIGALGNIMLPFSIMKSPRAPALQPARLTQLITSNSHLNWGRVNLPNLPKRSLRLDDVIEKLPDDSPHWWPEKEAQKLLSQMKNSHRAQAEKMRLQDEYTYGTVYRRVREGETKAELRTDGIAGCLRVPRGGSSKQFLLRAGKGAFKARALTAREYGRLQGVRDTYRIDGVSENHARCGFGDAVCVPVIEWIAEHCLNPLAEKAIEHMALTA